MLRGSKLSMIAALAAGGLFGWLAIATSSLTASIHAAAQRRRGRLPEQPLRNAGAGRGRALSRARTG
jgi:hypothetical protein